MTGAGNNTYLLIGSDRSATLIDAGVGNPLHLSAIADELDRASATLARILVTHAHPDHASGAPVLARAYPNATFAKYPWPEPDATYPAPWRRLNDGDRFPIGDDEVVALHTPGHSPDHVAFVHTADEAVFIGDLVVLGSSVMIHSSGGGDLAEYLTSLERIRALKSRRLLPAHGPEITDPEKILSAQIAHRLARESQVLEALRLGRNSVESITDSIYDGLQPALVPAARETVRAHLKKLKNEGRVDEQTDGRFLRKV